MNLHAAKHTHHEQAADGIAFAKANNLAAAHRGATAFASCLSKPRAVHQPQVRRTVRARYILGTEGKRWPIQLSLI
jgi:hypothetical protein